MQDPNLQNIYDTASQDLEDGFGVDTAAVDQVVKAENSKQASGTIWSTIMGLFGWSMEMPEITGTNMTFLHFYAAI